MKEAITALAEKSKDAKDATGAMKFAQAALSLAQAEATQWDTERTKDRN